MGTTADPGTYLTLADIAARMGWTVKTARTLHFRASRNRADGHPRPGDLPEPDHRFGQSPVWHSDTITAWEHNRPGQGAGGGRPR